MLTISKRRTRIGPKDHGRKMSLKEFEFIDTEEGYLYELSRGYIAVSNVARFYHALIVSIIRDALIMYKAANPGSIYMILAGHECKLLIREWESERHPDIAVYVSKPKGPKDNKMWRHWVPGLAIEVVSERSTDRDYIEKRQEYWDLGIKAYWIVDAKREEVVLLRRGKTDWIDERIGPDGVIGSKLLPGFELPFKTILDAVADTELEDE